MLLLHIFLFANYIVATIVDLIILLPTSTATNLKI